MIYIIMSTILVLAIIFILVGIAIVTANEETNNNDKGTDTNSDKPDSETVSGPTQVEATASVEQPKRVSKPRKSTKSGGVQPSAKRTSKQVTKRVIKKPAVK